MAQHIHPKNTGAYLTNQWMKLFETALEPNAPQILMECQGLDYRIQFYLAPPFFYLAAARYQFVLVTCYLVMYADECHSNTNSETCSTNQAALYMNILIDDIRVCYLDNILTTQQS